jgi:hypothetical protein
MSQVNPTNQNTHLLCRHTIRAYAAHATPNAFQAADFFRSHSQLIRCPPNSKRLAHSPWQSKPCRLYKVLHCTFPFWSIQTRSEDNGPLVTVTGQKTASIKQGFLEVSNCSQPNGSMVNVSGTGRYFRVGALIKRTVLAS